MKRHKVFEWFVSAIVGTGLIVLFLNRGMFFHTAAATSSSLGATAGSVNIVVADAKARAILANMTEDEKIGQLIIPMSSDTSMNADMTALIQQYQIGGYFIPEYTATAQQLHDFVNQMQAASKIPMLMVTDFEGGGWNTLRAEVGERPYPSDIGATGNTQLAYQKGVVDAQLLKSVGLNADFAPVVDVLTNPNDTILLGRVFGSDPNLVTKMAQAYLQGLASGGIPGCLKHFPGLGASSVDPHKALPVINRTLQQLQTVDWVPYEKLIPANLAPMIMITHILIPALDPNLPASISPSVINGYLRHTLGYNGVVVSDALFMGGLSYKYTVPQAGLLAFEAGTDLLLGALNAAQALETINLIKSAISSGQITQSYLDNSVLRILTFKLQWGIIPVNFTLNSGTSATVLQIPGQAVILNREPSSDF